MAFNVQKLTSALSAFSNSPTLTTPTITSPTLVTPAIGVATGTSLAVTGAISTSAGNITITSGNLINTAGYIQNSVGNALTAVGTNRATALQLAKAINNVTSAASGTGVTLPLVSAVGVGGMVVLFNAGGNDIKVYGAGSDTIDGVAAATGVTLTDTKRAVFIAVAAATWISAQLGVVSA